MKSIKSIGKFFNNKVDKNTGITISCQGRQIPFSYGPNFSADDNSLLIRAAESSAMRGWLGNYDKITGKMNLHSIQLQSIDFFGKRVGFVKISADITDKDGDLMPGIVFMRGPSVSCLVILDCDGIEYVALVCHNSAAAGIVGCLSLPAGMLDGNGNFDGAAAKEIKEELGIEIRKEDMIDLTQMTYEDRYNGVYPSNGGTDEYVRLFMSRKKITNDELGIINGKLTGLAEEGEKLSVKIVPLADLWKISPDVKALSSLALYDALKKANRLN